MTEGSDRTVGLAQAHDMIILPSDRDRRPRRLLIECKPPIAREFQAGEQRAGDGSAAAQFPSGFLGAGVRQECRQSTDFSQRCPAADV